MENISIGEIFLWMFLLWAVLNVIKNYLKAKNELLNEEIKYLTEKVKNSYIHVKIEKHNDVFYLFEQDTHRFIAQGASFEEVQIHCKERFKDKIVVATEEDIDAIGLK